MNEKAQAIITAIGATAEMYGELRRQLIHNGFTRKEALEIIKTIAAGQFGNHQKNTENT